MSDDTEGQLINFPVGTDVTDRPPQLPDPGRLFPDTSERSTIPPESPEETTLELPAVPAAPRPEAALVSSREIPLADPSGISAEETEEGEYVQPRSLADRLGDWLEYRLEVARERRAEEAPFREAEIARKAALLESRTAQETAMMEQNAKFHAAQAKAKADKAAARGKADAARSSGSGTGADKGSRSKAGGGGGSRGGGGSSGGTGRGGTGRGSGGGNSPKGSGKGSDRSAGGRGGASKGNESSGGRKGRQNGSGGSGGGKSGTHKGSSGGLGKKGSGNSGSGKGGSKGDGGKTQHSPAPSPRAERARGRQERAAARQAARQQRRSADQAANLADRSKDRDQDRANRQAEREERRRAKAERKAARKAKREAAKTTDDRTTIGEAMAEETQRRWDKRHADAKDAKDGEDGTEKVSPTKDKDKEKEAEGKGTDSKDDEDAKDASAGPSGSSNSNSEKQHRWFRRGHTAGTGGAGRRDRSRRTRRTARSDRPSDSPFGAEDSTPTVEWPKHPTRPPRTAGKSEDDIVDAYIVPDGPAAVTTGVKGLPPAPEKHTQRPGTTRPTAQEDPVASEVSRPTSGQADMAAKHRTDITFGEYLVEIVNIAIAAARDKDRAQDLAIALGKVADALRDMAADLVGDHNIATEVVDQITDLADAATRMKQLAERCATECEIASEAARIAARSVGRVYGEDIEAMDDAGLAHASAAAHHD
ncbi:ATP/GTP-binding protein [Streptomyces sp. NPDC013433]|uniref:ATP/GTP-binding protein n=1 Tax=Streptomyces sp. NPDC013433 TaxID=3155604 RepID=UPI003456EAA6